MSVHEGLTPALPMPIKAAPMLSFGITLIKLKVITSVIKKLKIFFFIVFPPCL